MKRDVGGAGQRTQEILTAIWREILETDQVEADDDFFELGGTSYDVVLVIASLNRELGTDVSEIDLFERPTIRAMTELLLSPDPPRAGEIVRSRRRGERRRELQRARTQGTTPNIFGGD